MEENHEGSSLVPNVQGMTLRDAIYILENIGLKVSVSGHGRVKSQSVRPVRITEGRNIKIVLG